MPNPAPTTLDELLDLLCAGTMWDGAPTVSHTPGVDWTALPTFGGSEPRDTSGVWSWDATHLLRGDCARDLWIEPREDVLFTAETAPMYDADDRATMNELADEAVAQWEDSDEYDRDLTPEFREFVGDRIQSAVYDSYASTGELVESLVRRALTGYLPLV